jgi:carbohydrate-selective porin OprB
VKTRLQRARVRLRGSLNKHFRAVNGRRTAWIGFFLVAAMSLLSTLTLFAQEPTEAMGSAPPESNFLWGQYMPGDWGGERSRLAEKGVTFAFHYCRGSAGEFHRRGETNTGWVGRNKQLY